MKAGDQLTRNPLVSHGETRNTARMSHIPEFCVQILYTGARRACAKRSQRFVMAARTARSC